MEQFGQEGTFSGHQIQPHELHLHPTFDLSEKTTKINDNYYFKEGICIGLICIHLSFGPVRALPGIHRDVAKSLSTIHSSGSVPVTDVSPEQK